MEPSGDDGQAAGEPCSSISVQWRAAHSPAGQRQAGELIFNSLTKDS